MFAPKLWTLNFVLICCASLSMTMSFYLIMPVLPFFLSEQFGMDGFQIGLAISIYVIGSLVIRPLTGYALDRWGRRGIFLASFLTFGLTAAAYPYLHTISAIFILRFVHGLIWGSSLTSSMTVAVDIIPRERRGEGIGFFTFAMAVAMALGPALGLWIYNTWGGMATFWTSMAIGTGGALISCGMRWKPHARVSIPLVWGNFFEPKVIPISMAALMFTFAYGGLTNFIAVYVKQEHAGTLDASFFYIFLAVGTSISRLKGGKMFDRAGPRRVAALGFSMLIAGFTALWMISFDDVAWLKAGLFWIAAFLVGMGGGFCMPAFQAMVTLILPVTRQGVGNATYASVFEFGIASGIAMTGWLSQHVAFQWIYLASAAWLAFTALVFFRLIAGSYEKVRRQFEAGLM